MLLGVATPEISTSYVGFFLFVFFLFCLLLYLSIRRKGEYRLKPIGSIRLNIDARSACSHTRKILFDVVTQRTRIRSSVVNSSKIINDSLSDSRGLRHAHRSVLPKVRRHNTLFQFTLFR